MDIKELKDAYAEIGYSVEEYPDGYSLRKFGTTDESDTMSLEMLEEKLEK